MGIKRENIGWVDLLRVIACFLVVVSHCCDPFVAGFDGSSNFLTGVFTGSSMRPCVPLFVMMTGVLMFPVMLSMGEFYRKRISRIIVPLVFWSVALPLMFFVYLNYINPGTMNPSIKGLPADSHTLGAIGGKLYAFIFNFNFDTTPLWYLYMLVGLYLVIPILGAWLKQASAKDVRTFLMVWGIALLLPYVKMAAPLLGYPGNYGNMGILGVCDWNDYGTFYYFSGFIGYLVLAYYLVTYPLNWSWSKVLGVGIPMFAVGYLITSLGFLFTQQHFPGEYAKLEIVWYFAGINVFMMTFPVFIIVQKLKVPSSPLLARLASYTMGIYLCHFVFVQVAYDIFEPLSGSVFPLVRLLGAAVTSFVMSGLLVWAMFQLPITRRLVK